jgi:DNA-binding HxlR family transcriptional regulator
MERRDQPTDGRFGITWGALRVIWELREGRLTFRALQEACGGVSPTVLNERLRESGLLESARAAGYGLTARGRELIEQFRPLVAWSARWAAALTCGRGTPRSSR